MDEPKGPQPSSVYRRRRIMAMAGSAAGALLFVWAVGALLGGNDVPSVHGTANGVPLATRPAQSSNPPPTGPIRVAGSSSNSPSPSPTPTTTTTTTTTATTTTSPAPPQECPDSVMRVTATAAPPVSQVGDHVRLTLRIANGGPVACVRDVSRQVRSISVLTAEGKTLWSSSDCYAVTTHDIRTLAPNEGVSYTVVWYGRTSAHGCPGHRTTVPAGKYQLVGQLGQITGPPTILTID